jgi:hypothetical protein
MPKVRLATDATIDELLGASRSTNPERLPSVSTGTAADAQVSSIQNELYKMKESFDEIKKARDEAVYQVGLAFLSILCGCPAADPTLLLSTPHPSSFNKKLRRPTSTSSH